MSKLEFAHREGQACWCDECERRERFATRLCVVLIVVFVALAFGALFGAGPLP